MSDNRGCPSIRCEKHRKESQDKSRCQEKAGITVPKFPELTAVLLVAAIRTVLKSIAAEAADDAVDAAGTGEKGWATF